MTGNDQSQMLPYFAATYGLPLTPAYGLAPFAPLVAHPNGAVVPLEPKDVRICRDVLFLG